MRYYAVTEEYFNKHFTTKNPNFIWKPCWNISSNEYREYLLLDNSSYHVRDNDNPDLSIVVSNKDFKCNYKLTNEADIQFLAILIREVKADMIAINKKMNEMETAMQNRETVAK